MGTASLDSETRRSRARGTLLLPLPPFPEGSVLVGKWLLPRESRRLSSCGLAQSGCWEGPGRVAQAWAAVGASPADRVGATRPGPWAGFGGVGLGPLVAQAEPSALGPHSPGPHPVLSHVSTVSPGQACPSFLLLLKPALSGCWGFLREQNRRKSCPRPWLTFQGGAVPGPVLVSMVECSRRQGPKWVAATGV